MAMFVVKSIVTQINDDVYGSINTAVVHESGSGVGGTEGDRVVNPTLYTVRQRWHRHLQTPMLI